MGKYRGECCYTEEKGKEMVEMFDVLAFAREVHEFEASKYDDPAFEKGVSISKIGIAEIEKLLTDVLEKEQYIKFSSDKPEIDRYVIVPFSLQDSDGSRSRKDNLRDLEKLITKALEGTNWRLLSNSLTSRLGFISGRLKGYEQEEDLLEISGYKKEKEKKLDPEKMAKWGHHNIVQLEKLLGEHEGIENMRKRRLVKEPEGFLLEDTGSSYTCTICHEQSPTGETWWLPDALWCKECKRNIDKKVIPKLFYFEDKHDKNWFTESDIKYDYDLKWNQIRKLEKEGLLHPRLLKNSLGQDYCSVYLLKENREFFETHQKVKKVRPIITHAGSDDKKTQL